MKSLQEIEDPYAETVEEGDDESDDDDWVLLREIKLMNEYTVDLPLWPETCWGARTKGEIDDVMSKITPRLQKSLRALAKRFNEHFHWDRGWDDASREERHREHMYSAFRRLKEQLGPEWNVTMDLWECRDDDRPA